MALASGARLGPYEILSALGAGGMGEVYRARDGTLQRDVALKILPELLALDPDRLARFRREAQLLAALNHPNIAAIYGFEESTGVQALVLELVEGPTLADRIAGGPIPLDEALPIARQIAEALAAAHELGIIHRDLKPANIKQRPDGAVKVLDFGLAKLAQPEANGERADVTVSPTITSPAMMTGVGTILGTAAYMAPEQAKGRAADKRSDVWALGCVLYEMLTGRRPFDGEDITEVLGAVVRLEPRWEALPSDVPPVVRTLLQQCLVKDRRKRIADIAVALYIFEHHASVPATGTASAPSMPLWRRAAPAAVASLVAAGVATTLMLYATRAAPPSVVRSTLTTSGATVLAVQGADRDVAITPDGSRVVYRGNNQLLVRALDQMEPTVLKGLGAPRGVFISPDGQWVGYFDGARLQKVAITGGSPIPVTHAVGRSGLRGATWGPDGTIIFATSAPDKGLERVSSAGGEASAITRPDARRGEREHAWPEFLPGGKAVLFTITPSSGINDDSQIAVLDLETGTSKVLLRGGSHAHYVAPGHLVYGLGGSVRAVAFDLDRLEVAGTPVTVVEGVVTSRATGVADMAVAANGSLVYVPATGNAGQQVMLVDRQGRASSLPGLPLGSYTDVRASPDGARLALTLDDDVWVYDLFRTVLTRLTSDPALDNNPLWTPDGQRIIFTSRRRGFPELFSRQADGSGSDEPFMTRAKDLLHLRANEWSPDGRQLLLAEIGATQTIREITLGRPSDGRLLITSDSPSPIHPGGSWIAYQQSGQIYVERYPNLGSRQQISPDGGVRPTWSRDGHELFFSSRDGRQVFAVAIQAGLTLLAGRPQRLFEFDMLPAATGNRPYDLGADGRFVIIRSGTGENSGGAASNLIVVQNWTEDLKRLVPVN